MGKSEPSSLLLAAVAAAPLALERRRRMIAGMNSAFQAAALAVAVSLGGTWAAVATPAVDRLADAVRRATVDQTLGTSADARRAKVAEAEAVAARQSADGSWADVDYANPSRGSWPSVLHCKRVVLLAAAADGADAAAQRDRLHADAIRALDWWRARDPKCLNWWYNEIGVPAQLGRAAILLDPHLPPADREYVTGTVLPRAGKQKMTGTNAVWLADNLFLLAVLQRDGPGVTSCVKTVFGQAVVTTGEGIQPDGSFHQHGPQQQFGNYGKQLFEEVTDLAATTAPAGWPLTGEQLDALRHFALDGLQWTCWHGVMDVSACDRELFPNSGQTKARDVDRALATFATLSPTDRPACEAAARRDVDGGTNDLVGDRYFWRSDYGVHRRPGFMATLRMCSTRVVGGESVNSENLAGYFLGTGATFFYRDGREYQDALPLYDWRKIPGVTCPWSDGPTPTFSRNKNGSAFVGGATDGTDAAVAFDLRRDGVSADKAYFFVGDDVVCLGTAIVAAAVADPIVTTVDQFASPGAPVATPASARAFEDHGLRYELLSAGSLSVESREKTGAWDTVFRNGATPKGTVRGTITTLWIDHGHRPTGVGYAYRVCLAAAAAAHPVRVVSNTSVVQAVEVDGLVAAVLRAAGTVTVAGREVRVDQPCALLADPATRTVTVADPTQKLTTIQVGVGDQTVTVTLPTGGMAGSSVGVMAKGW